MYEDNARGEQLLAVLVVFLLVPWAFALARGYVKIWILKKVALEDWLMFASILIYTVFMAVALVGVAVGHIGMHESDLSPPQLLVAMRSWWICEVIYVPLSCIIRSSIAIFLLKIATRKLHRVVIWANMGVVWLVSFIAFFINLLQCSPVNYFWMWVMGEPGTCIDHRVVPFCTIAQSTVSALSDVILALLPIVMLWNVRMNKRTKVTVAILLSLGIVAAAALIVRICYVRVYSFSDDFLYRATDLAISTVLEPGLGIIAGCGATLRPLFSGWGFGTKSTLANEYPNSRSIKRPTPHENWQWQESCKAKKAGNETGKSVARGGAEASPDSSQMELTEFPHSPSRKSGPDLEAEAGKSDDGWSLPLQINVCTTIDVVSRQTPRSETPRAVLGWPRNSRRLLDIAARLANKR